MSDWSLSKVLSSLHDVVEQRLGIARATLAHATTKGDASESAWLGLLQTYLPRRYSVARAHVVDSDGQFSDQFDVVIFDRQYSPLIFHFEGQTIVPAEGVYAVFEAKQTVNAKHVAYAGQKVATVRSLKRTSLPIPHAGGTYTPKDIHHILGGVLALESEWNPPLGEHLKTALDALDERARLDLGCVAAHGVIARSNDNFEIRAVPKPATAFLLELIARLQEVATVPMLDVRAYARWLDRV